MAKIQYGVKPDIFKCAQFSARVPRSSSELHRDFSDHILEDEVDRQEEEQGDQRDRDEEREVKGVGEINE